MRRSWSRGVEQPGGLRPRFFGDRGPRQHPRDFLAALLCGELAYAGPRAALAVAFLDPVMMRGARGDLRRVRDDQHLTLLGEAREPFADRACDRAADPAVHLVED